MNWLDNVLCQEREVYICRPGQSSIAASKNLRSVYALSMSWGLGQQTVTQKLCSKNIAGHDDATRTMAWALPDNLSLVFHEAQHAPRRDAASMRARLKDLAFAVDVSNEALFGGATLADIWERGTVTADDPL